MADVVDPVLVNPGSRVMTPIVVSSLEISIPDEPSVAGMTLSSSCLSPYVSDAVAGASTVASTGGANVTAPVCSATLAGATLAVAAAASAVWVTSGIRVLASRSCRDNFDLARAGARASALKLTPSQVTRLLARGSSPIRGRVVDHARKPGANVTLCTPAFGRQTADRATWTAPT